MNFEKAINIEDFADYVSDLLRPDEDTLFIDLSSSRWLESRLTCKTYRTLNDKLFENHSHAEIEKMFSIIQNVRYNNVMILGLFDGFENNFINVLKSISKYCSDKFRLAFLNVSPNFAHTIELECYNRGWNFMKFKKGNDKFVCYAQSRNLHYN